MHLITIRDQVCNVMASLTKTFVSPDIVLQNLEAITACSSWTKACTATTCSSVVFWAAAILYARHCYRHAKLFFDDIQVASGLQAAKQHTCPFFRLGFRTARLASEQRGSPVDLLVQGPKLLYSLLTLVFTHLWWPCWSPWCSSPGNS